MDTQQVTFLDVLPEQQLTQDERVIRDQRKLEAARLDACQVQETLAQIRRIAEGLTAKLQADKYRVQSPGEAADLVMYDMSAETQEVLKVISLDTRNNVISIDTIYRGSINSSQVRVCELFRSAIIHNATSIIVVHNHPSGDPTPSPDDIGITRAIVQAGKILDMDVLDHLVIGGGRFISLKERGLGFS